MELGGAYVDLRLTLVDSAQCFRWVEADRAFGAVFSGKPVWLFEGARGIVLDGGDCAFFRNYLDLDRDYDALFEKYRCYPAAKTAFAQFPGLRRLNQPPWETLISFILSANNNVSRIRSLVMKLSQALGERIDTPRGALYAFPTPQALAGADETALRALGVGYRAPFLIKTAEKVAGGFSLEALSQMPYAEAHKALVQLPGVGDKVADCVLLLGCAHARAFPVDVWVERLLRNWFGVREKNRRALSAIARETFGDDGGIVQMYLFHAARIGAIAL